MAPPCFTEIRILSLEAQVVYGLLSRKLLKMLYDSLNKLLPDFQTNFRFSFRAEFLFGNAVDHAAFDRLKFSCVCYRFALSVILS